MSMLPDSKYVWFKVDSIPERIYKHYDLHLKEHNGYVYARINKAWYRLKQAGKIAHNDLVEHLAQHGYVRASTMDGLFKHKTRNISFTLIVDNFGIKYTSKKDIKHLILIMHLKYKFKVDFDAKQYIGINLVWDYQQRTVCCSMKDYIKQARIKLKHIPTNTRHHAAPSRMTRPTYGAHV